MSWLVSGLILACVVLLVVLPPRPVRPLVKPLPPVVITPALGFTGWQPRRRPEGAGGPNPPPRVP